MAIETVLTTDQLIVTGPPSTVTVRVDTGDTGPRGSVTFTGLGNPNTSTFDTSQYTPKVGDLYINRELGSDYGVMYKLIPFANETTWFSVLKFQPLAYSATASVAFSSGTGSLSFPLSNFYDKSPTSLDLDTILLQATANSNNPTMISVSNKNIVEVNGVNLFVAELKAAQFSSGSVSALTSASPYLDIFISQGAVI